MPLATTTSTTTTSLERRAEPVRCFATIARRFDGASELRQPTNRAACNGQPFLINYVSSTV